MGRWALADHTEASLILLPPVRPLLVGLRQAEAGLEKKTKKQTHGADCLTCFQQNRDRVEVRQSKFKM